MTDVPRAGTGNFVGTIAPGRQRPGVGIIWLDRLSLVAHDGGHPLSQVADGARAATVGATVEVPPGYLVVDVRVGYATAAGGFVGELRVVDLAGHGKSALLLLERREAGDEPAETVFVDAPTAPTGKRTYLAIRASVADHTDHVAVRGLRLSLTRA
jgi:hypothetical protein